MLHVAVSFSIKILSCYLLVQGDKKDLTMSGRNNSPKSDLNSIKYNRNQQGGASLEADLSCVNFKPRLSNNENQECYENSSLKSPKILTTAQLISAIGHIWDSASQSLSCFDPKENVNQDNKGFRKEKVLDNFGKKINGRVYTSNDTNYSPVDLRATSYLSSTMQANIDFPRVTQKMFAFESCNGSQVYIRSLVNKFFQSSVNISDDSWKAKEIVNKEISFKLGNIHWRNSGNASKGLKFPVKVSQLENRKTAAPVAGGSISVDASTPEIANEDDECNPNIIIYDDPPPSSDSVLDARKDTSLSLDYYPRALHDTMLEVGVTQTSSSSISSDNHINSLATCDNASVGCQPVIDDNELMETKQKHFSGMITYDESKAEVSSANEKPNYSLAKQEHAFSGALAGVCVSLCLHPVDTIKTVIQSCRAEKKSIFYIGKSIVSDRGWSF